jgi:hypothetical protein
MQISQDDNVNGQAATNNGSDGPGVTALIISILRGAETISEKDNAEYIYIPEY